MIAFPKIIYDKTNNRYLVNIHFGRAGSRLKNKFDFEMIDDRLVIEKEEINICLENMTKEETRRELLRRCIINYEDPTLLIINRFERTKNLPESKIRLYDRKTHDPITTLYFKVDETLNCKLTFYNEQKITFSVPLTSGEFLLESDDSLVEYFLNRSPERLRLLKYKR